MKISTLAFAVLSFTQTLVDANESGCVTTVEDGKDYFPVKAVIENSKQWAVSYETTYKIVTNVAAGETYVLYQCGTEIPTIENDGIFSIPLEEVGLYSTTQIPFLEMLGARDKIANFLGSASWISSPCMGELFDQGLFDEGMFNTSFVDNTTLARPTFVENFGGAPFLLPNEIKVSNSEEDDNLAVFEWIKFYATFFNLEETANEIFTNTKNRYTCATENAGYLSCDDKPKPVVLWGYYSSYCGGWDVATCPNYYCEFTESCQAEILSSADQGSFYSDLCYRNYMTTEEFIAFGKDADIWIYPSPDFEQTLTDFGDVLAAFVSVKKQAVYDTEGSGPNAWFEQRLVEPDVILQDFCTVVGHENLDATVPHVRSWLRNVYTEAMGSLGECEDPSAPLVPKSSECFPVSADYCATKGESDSGTTPDEEDPDVDEVPEGDAPSGTPSDTTQVGGSDSAFKNGMFMTVILGMIAFLI